PSRDPALAIIVVIDSPHGVNRYFGGTVSAPVFKRIGERALQYLGVGPTINPSTPVMLARESEAPTPSPAPTAGATRPGPVVSLVANGPPGTIPDLRRLSARDAIRTLVRIGLTATVSGTGFVVSQDPSPGAPLDSGA